MFSGVKVRVCGGIKLSNKRGYVCRSADSPQGRGYTGSFLGGLLDSSTPLLHPEVV